jgi:superfamily II DNA or RNA helicase
MFAKFLLTFSDQSHQRGKQFEIFVKWFLENEPFWKSQVDEVWLWDNYPDNWGRDCGIDLVFRHKNGENWAVQAKCYAPTTAITKSDIDSFISESNRDNIHKRLLIASTDLIGTNAKQVCDAQVKPVIRFMLRNFEDAEIEYPLTFDELYKVRPKAKPLPREHQLEAIEVVAKKLMDTDKGQLIMACGTGKTFTTLWIKERLSATSTLVLLPSLSLLSQTLHEWTMACNESFEALCVCSDDSVGRSSDDESVKSISELPFPVTSKVDEIKAFLIKEGNKVVFSTYQSSPLISEAHKDQLIPEFDLIVSDEAHRTAGNSNTAFSKVLDPKLIKGKKRLFATATPRTYTKAVVNAGKERDIEIVGMDDSKVYGEVLYQLNFGEAISRGLLTDYQILIIGVTNSMIKSYIKNRELVTPNEVIEGDAESLASQIGLLKAISEYDLKRLITFHSRVNKAKQFSEEIKEVFDWVKPMLHSPVNLKTDYVSGEMPTNLRRLKLKTLKNTQKDEVSLISNARCLSEGVDVPSLDGVAFIDPKGSQVDIIQAVGRAIRLSPKKEKGHIILPVFVGDGEDSEIELAKSNFKSIWEVLKALKAHDDVLSDELDSFRLALGKRGRPSINKGFEKIVVDLPVEISDEFATSLKILLVENTTHSWNHKLGLLQKFYEREGHTRVKTGHIEDTVKLDQWVGWIRKLKPNLTPIQIEELNKLNFLWNVPEERWEEGFSKLLAFRKREGHVLVTIGHEEDGFQLANWVFNQRSIFRNGKMPADRVNRLKEIGFVWDKNDDAWNTGYQNLLTFYTREGHTNVSLNFEESSFKLGGWVAQQRKNKGGLALDRIKKLEEISFLWDPLDEKWSKAFELLKKYKLKYGDCLVPQSFIDEDVALGAWVGTQRKAINTMSKERKKLLEGIGFIWDKKESIWQERYLELIKYKNKFGNCNVNSEYVVNDVNLGPWVATLRQRKSKLSSEQIRLLDDLDFNWDPLGNSWGVNFKKLESHYKEYGTSKLSKPKEKSDPNYSIYIWAKRQRLDKEKLTSDQIDSLNSINFDWNPLDSLWNRAFEELQNFQKKNNHINVPKNYAGTFKTLDQWIRKHKKLRAKLSEVQISKLESIPQWQWTERS